MSGPGLDLLKRKLKKILLGIEEEEVEDDMNARRCFFFFLNNKMPEPEP